MDSPSWRATIFPALLAVLLCGCATPIEVKTASARQLELIDSLDAAIRELEHAFERFHREQAALMREEGRMNVARAAVLVATDPDREVTADRLFETYEAQVYPWIADAFDGLTIAEIDARIAELKAQIEAETDTLTRAKLTVEKNRLDERRALLGNKPAEVASIEDTVRERLAAAQAISEETAASLRLLRTQVGLMRAMQSRIDAWLAIDISPSQEQIDGLKSSLLEARDALSGDSP